MNDVAMSVGKYLEFDVPRRSNEFLDQDPPGAESRLAFAGRRFERRIKVGVFVDATQATTAAAGCRLDENRIADLVGLLAQEFGVLAFAVIAGHNRNTGLRHEALSLVLKPHGADSARKQAWFLSVLRRALFAPWGLRTRLSASWSKPVFRLCPAITANARTPNSCARRPTRSAIRFSSSRQPAAAVVACVASTNTPTLMRRSKRRPAKANRLSAPGGS